MVPGFAASPVLAQTGGGTAGSLMPAEGPFLGGGSGGLGGATARMPAGGGEAATGDAGANGLLDLRANETLLHEHLPWLVTGLDAVASLIDVAAIVILLIGAIRFVLGVAVAEIARRGPDRVRRTNRQRIELGRYILAGLELFIVSDVIHTALSLRMADLIFLLVLVVIRSITSYFLDRELEGLKQELGT